MSTNREVEPHRTCGKTNPSGEYEIQSLTPGQGEPEGGYAVEFTSTLDYVKQFYGGGLENYSSTLIPIVLGETVPNIDAELEEGGEITGRLISAGTKAPIEGARVCAGRPQHSELCARTTANGEYVILGLASGQYTVWFGGPTGMESNTSGSTTRKKNGLTSNP